MISEYDFWEAYHAGGYSPSVVCFDKPEEKKMSKRKMICPTSKCPGRIPCNHERPHEENAVCSVPCGPIGERGIYVSKPQKKAKEKK